MDKVITINHLDKENGPVLSLDWAVLEKIIKTIGTLSAETGGALGGFEGETEISQFYFDESSRTSAVTYSPDYKMINKIFKNDWNPKGIRLRGFVHSHPGRMSRPSFGDELYAERILSAIEDLDCLWLPIIATEPDTGVFSLSPWAVIPAKKGVEVIRGKVKIVNAPAKSALMFCGENVLKSVQPGVEHDDLSIGNSARTMGRRAIIGLPGVHKKEEAVSKSKIPSFSILEENVKSSSTQSIFSVRNTFNRVRDAYDLGIMNSSRLIIVGAGGAACWIEEMARAGITQFVLIDPDKVSETNLATQQVYRRDIGRPKVDCIAERILDINPSAIVIALQKSLDELTDEDIRRLAQDPLAGHVASRTLLCGLTDAFFAQARVNRLALALGIPSICAQVYKEGRGAEITFTYPGVTPACHRCILSSRYRHFLDHGQTNDVTSHGTPIFSTTRLNAIKGFLTLALLHHGSAHPRWGSMLSRIGTRNLVQVRMDPDFADTTGIKVFNRVFEKADQERLFFDEVVWLPQAQECPETGYAPCPDCGGTGDLRSAIGTIKETALTTSTRLQKAATDAITDPNALRAHEAYSAGRRLS